METRRYPYECCDLLDCINNEELPILYMKLILTYAPNTFYSGCIIAEIRDYRQSHSISECCDNYFALLRPTTQTISADIANCAMKNYITHIDRLVMEKHMVLFSAKPMCIVPNPIIGHKAIYNQYKKTIWNTPEIRRHMRQFSQVAINRKEKSDKIVRSHHRTGLMEFLAKYAEHEKRKEEKAKNPSRSGVSWVLPSKPRQAIQQAPPVDLDRSMLTTPKYLNVFEFVHQMASPTSGRSCTPALLEEFIFETVRTNVAQYYIKLNIYHRFTMDEYVGRLWVDRTIAEEQDDNLELSPFFSIGNRVSVTNYIHQLTMIITEKGRKSVRITSLKPNRTPSVLTTVGTYYMCIQMQLHTIHYLSIARQIAF